MKKPKPRCIKCGSANAKQSFSICADDAPERHVCTPCDIALNALVLDFMNIPNRAKLMLHYIARKA